MLREPVTGSTPSSGITLVVVLALLLPAGQSQADSVGYTDLVVPATRGQLDQAERDALEAVEADSPALPAARALLLADAQAGTDVARFCALSLSFLEIAPPRWKADAHLERARCLALEADYEGARAALVQAESSPEGFGGELGDERSLWLVELDARILSKLVALGAGESFDGEQVDEAEARWKLLAKLAAERGDNETRNRARRVSYDLSAYRTNPSKGYRFAASYLELLGGSVGSLLDVVGELPDAAGEDSGHPLDGLGPRGFQGVAWGSSPDSVRATRDKGPREASPKRLVYADQLAGIDCVAIYRFRAQGLDEGAYMVTEPYSSAGEAHADYRRLSSMLSTKYGASDESIEEVQWRGKPGEDPVRALGEGRVRFVRRWTFTRTLMRLRLDKEDGRYKLRIVYSRVQRKAKEEAPQEEDPADVDLDKL